MLRLVFRLFNFFFRLFDFFFRLFCLGLWLFNFLFRLLCLGFWLLSFLFRLFRFDLWLLLLFQLISGLLLAFRNAERAGFLVGFLLYLLLFQKLFLDQSISVLVELQVRVGVNGNAFLFQEIYQCAHPDVEVLEYFSYSISCHIFSSIVN